MKARKLNYKVKRIRLSFKDRIFESAKGGGTIYGKIKLTFFLRVILQITVQIPTLTG